GRARAADAAQRAGPRNLPDDRRPGGVPRGVGRSARRGRVRRGGRARAALAGRPAGRSGRKRAPPMNPDFRARVTAALAAYYGILADDIDRPGTTLHPIDPDEWEGWLELVPVGARTAIAVPPGLRDEVRRVLAARPADHPLSGADFKAVWGD